MTCQGTKTHNVAQANKASGNARCDFLLVSDRLQVLGDMHACGEATFNSLSVELPGPAGGTTTVETQDNKDQPNGYAGLDADGRLPVSLLPAADEVDTPSAISMDTTTTIVDTVGADVFTPKWAAWVHATTYVIEDSTVSETGYTALAVSYGGSALNVYNSNGTLYGTIPIDSGNNIGIVVYDLDGNVSWTARIVSSAPIVRIFDLHWGRSGNLLTRGTWSTSLSTLTLYDSANVANSNVLTKTAGGNTDVFIAKFGSDGLDTWIAKIASAGNDDAFANKTYTIRDNKAGEVVVVVAFGGTINIYSEGNTFITKTVVGSVAPYTDIVIAKYSPNGYPAWAATATNILRVYPITSDINEAGEIILGLSVEDAAAVTFSNYDGTVGAMFVPPGGGLAGIVTKYSASGVYQFTSTANGSGDPTTCNSVAFTPTGDILMSGDDQTFLQIWNADNNITMLTANVPGIQAAYIIKFSSTGFMIWFVFQGGTNIDSYGEIFPMSDGFYLKFGAATANAAATAPIMNSDGTLYATVPSSAAAPASDYVVRYDYDGFASQYLKQSLDDVSVHNDGAISGERSGTSNLYDSAGVAALVITSPTGTSVFVAKYENKYVMTIPSGPSNGFLKNIVADGGGDLYIRGALKTADGVSEQVIVDNGAQRQLIWSDVSNSWITSV